MTETAAQQTAALAAVPLAGGPNQPVQAAAAAAHTGAAPQAISLQQAMLMQQQMVQAFPVLADINAVAQLTGIQPQVLATQPQMLFMAQQMATQRLIMSGQVQRQGAPVTAVGATAPAPAAAARGARGARGGRGGGSARAKGRKRKEPEPNEELELLQPQGGVLGQPSSYNDPGGRLVWAKVGTYPWWPAKELDPHKDVSFPQDADPPRPTSIPIRFFGTYEFEWIGSKRQLVDYEQGLAQGHQNEDDQESFKAAIAEVEAYRQTRRLPDVFYIQPQPEKKERARGRKRGSKPGGAGGSLAGGRAAALLSPEEHAAAVAARQKRILQQLALVPPDGSPYVGGVICSNPELQRLAQQWRADGALPNIAAADMGADVPAAEKH